MAVVMKNDAPVVRRARLMGGMSAACLAGGLVTFTGGASALVSMGLVVAGLALGRQTLPYLASSGARLVAHHLTGLPRGFHAYHALKVPFGTGQTIQLDHVVVGPTGLFVIATRDYTGTIHGGAQDPWRQVVTSSAGEYAYPCASPVAENARRVQALREDLGRAAPASIQSIICFTDPRVQLDVEELEGAEVIRTGQLLDVLMAPPPRLDDLTVAALNSHLASLVRTHLLK